MSSRVRGGLKRLSVKLQLRTTDGKTIVVHETAHVSTNGAGEVTVDFDKNSVSCVG